MRALMTATVASMIGQFNMNNIKLLLDLGYEVDVACNFEDMTSWNKERIEKFKGELREMDINIYQIDFERSIFKINNHLRAYNQMRKLMNDRKYTLIHTHTPISSLLTRLAYRKSQIYTSCRMIYTAHGFHFFKGNNPIKNIIFKAIERYGAKYTDTLITINKEDYNAAKKFRLKKNGNVEYVPGIGIDLDKIDSIQGNKEKLCNELNIPNDSILLLSVGELNDNKNHKIVIDILNKLPDNVHYLICGQGILKKNHLENAKEKGVDSRLHLLGFRNDVIQVMKSCDIFVFPSKREGLSVALMEAMASGLICVVSNIRGNNDLMNDYSNGHLFNVNNSDELIEVTKKVLKDKKINFSMYNYGVKTIRKKMKSIYSYD